MALVGAWFLEAWLGGITMGGLFSPVGGQPLASKCRTEPTGFCWGVLLTFFY